MKQNELNNLSYHIIGASSEDPEHPLISLVSNTNIQGWNSKKQCKYPQEIIIQFPKPVHLKKINLLLHQNKIPSKIDLYYFFPNTINDFNLNINSMIFNQIGFIKPNTDKNDFQTRELKKINLNENVLYFKLIFHKSIYNIRNPYDQVGLVGLEFFGYELTKDNIDKLYPNRNKNIDYFSKNYENLLPNSNINDSELDDFSLAKIEEIKSQLEFDVQHDNYDQAKILKELIQRIKVLGVKLKKLNDLKLKYIEIGNYNEVKVIKNEIERIKSIIEGGYSSIDYLPKNYNNNNNEK
jgi:centrosomal protein CEP104